MANLPYSIFEDFKSLAQEADKQIIETPIFFDKYKEWINLIQKAAEGILDDEPIQAPTLKSYLFPGNQFPETSLTKLLIESKSQVHSRKSAQKSTRKSSRKFDKTSKIRGSTEGQGKKSTRVDSRSSSRSSVKRRSDCVKLESAEKSNGKDQTRDHFTPAASDVNENVVKSVTETFKTPVDQMYRTPIKAITPAMVTPDPDQRITRSMTKTASNQKRKSSDESCLEAVKKPKIDLSHPAMNRLFQKVHAKISVTKDQPAIIAANTTPNTLIYSKSNIPKAAGNVSMQEKENQGLVRGKIVEQNKQKILSERQQKIEDKRRKREDKMQKIAAKRIQMEKDKEERQRLNQQLSAHSNIQLNKIKTAPIKPVIEIKTKPAGPVKPEGPMPPKNHERPPQMLNKKILFKNPEPKIQPSVNANTTYNLENMLSKPSRTTPSKSGHTTTSKSSAVSSKSNATPLLANKSSPHVALTPPSGSPTCYDVSEIRSDSEDEDDAPNDKPIPGWAKSIRLKNRLLKEYDEPFDVDKFFGNSFPTIRLADIMGTSRELYAHRTSSAIWDSPSQMF